MYLKIYKRDNHVTVAACDKEILGMTFSEGGLQLDVGEKFYVGRQLDIQELKGALEDATIANLTGNNVVNAAIDLEFIEKDNVLEVDGIKHAQLIVMP